MRSDRESIWLPQLGPGLQFPVFRLPLRQAGGVIPNGDELDEPGNGRPGIDWRFEHSILAVNAEGKIIEDVDAVGQDVGAAARRRDQPVRSARSTSGSSTPRGMPSTSSPTTARSWC